MKEQVRQTLHNGDFIMMPYYKRPTRNKPAIHKLFWCMVVYLKQNGIKVPYLRSDQAGIHWFEPKVHPQGGYDYDMVPPRRVAPLEAAFLSMRRRSA